MVLWLSSDFGDFSTFWWGGHLKLGVFRKRDKEFATDDIMLVRNILKDARASPTHPGGQLHSLPHSSECECAPSDGDNACAREGQTSAKSLRQPMVYMLVKKTE